MKTLFIFFVSIVILSGCKNATGPTFKSGGGGSLYPHVDPGDLHFDYCFDYYKAVIQVKDWKGNPCVTAQARSVDMHLAAGADSSGIIKICETVSCNNQQNPNTKIIPFVIYYGPIVHTYDTVVWKGDLTLIKYKEPEGEWPDPFIEIIITKDML